MPVTPEQDYISRIGGLHYALEITLRSLAVKSGKDARTTLETLRDEAIYHFKNSDIPANREMDHAEVVGPAIEVIRMVFDAAIHEL